MDDEINEPTDDIREVAEAIPPDIRRRCLEAALDAVDGVLAETPYRDIGATGRLELLDLLGHIAWTRFLDLEQERALEVDPDPDAPPRVH